MIFNIGEKVNKIIHFQPAHNNEIIDRHIVFTYRNKDVYCRFFRTGNPARVPDLKVERSLDGEFLDG
jgi:hypothetical protein